MVKVQQDKNKSILEKIKLHWILVALLIFSFCFAHAYYFQDEPKPNLTLNVYPKINGDILIWYNKSDDRNIKKWVNELDEFTRVYRFPQFTPGRRNKTVMCDYDKTVSKDKVCIIDMSSWYPCLIEKNFGYKTSPCVFLEAFQDRYWDLEFFSNTTELPESMPETLVRHIEDKVEENPEKIKTLWVSCNGKSPADKENIKEIRYIPMNGFPKYLFHNHKGVGYVRPTIAIQLVGIQIGIIVEIECKYWARNAYGVTRFEMLVDE